MTVTDASEQCHEALCEHRGPVQCVPALEANMSYAAAFVSQAPSPASQPLMLLSSVMRHRATTGEQCAAMLSLQAHGGTVTAGNASPVTDGAAALVLASREAAVRHSLPILAVLRGQADANQAPEWFTTTPSLAAPKVCPWTLPCPLLIPVTLPCAWPCALVAHSTQAVLPGATAVLPLDC